MRSKKNQYDISEPPYTKKKNLHAHHLSISVNVFTHSRTVTRSIRCNELTRTTDQTEPLIKHLRTIIQRDRRSDDLSPIPINQTSVVTKGSTIRRAGQMTYHPYPSIKQRMNTRRVYCISRAVSRAQNHQSNIKQTLFIYPLIIRLNSHKTRQMAFV